MSTNTNQYFQRLSFISLVAVYFLIFVGGVVRTTGSGMGCPDWPKCFGQWVPPTKVEQLPDNYKDIYSELRVRKNERFASTLIKLGYQEKAEQIRNDPSIREEQDFNATKTWVEYINRLIGASVGVFIVIQFFFSLGSYKSQKKLSVIAFISVVLVTFQGWIGSIVVSTNLTSWMITVHMLLALLILLVLIYLYVNRRGVHVANTNQNKFSAWFITGLVLMLVQIILGTQVRELIDAIASTGLARIEWIDRLGMPFFIHRSFSLLILGLQLYLFFVIFKAEQNAGLYHYTRLIAVLVLAEIGTGIWMAYGAIPPVAQPIHLVLSVLIFGFIYQAYLENKYGTLSKD